jgi:hypothetical protein
VAVAIAVLLAGVALLLSPGEALAWGPGTHVYLGTELLRSLNLVPGPIATLLAAHPIEFLYGSLAADISMAKKYAPVGRHCHHWHVAREIDEAAGAVPSLKATTLGYMCHLAADVVAHNVFVPRMLLLASSTRALGHSYWEHRMDAHVGSRYLSLARQAVTEFDHSRADALFDQVLSHTLFSFRTNRRIFRGLIRIQDFQRWQDVFDAVIDNSRWDLDPGDRERYLSASFDLMVGFLLRDESSDAVGADPIGEEALMLSKRVRRRVVMHEGVSAAPELRRSADDHFPLPGETSGAWLERGGTSELAGRIVSRSLSRIAPEPQQIQEPLAS